LSIAVLSGKLLSMMQSDESTPRWVWGFGIVALILVLGFVVLHLTGHGLGGHFS